MLQTAPTGGASGVCVWQTAPTGGESGVCVAYQWKILGFAPALFAKFLAIRRIIMYNT